MVPLYLWFQAVAREPSAIDRDIPAEQLGAGGNLVLLGHGLGGGQRNPLA